MSAALRPELEVLKEAAHWVQKRAQRGAGILLQHRGLVHRFWAGNKMLKVALTPGFCYRVIKIIIIIILIIIIIIITTII